MTKYRYRWPIIIGVSIAMWAGIVYAVKADGIRDAAIYIVDSKICALNVTNDQLGAALGAAMKERNIDLDTAVAASRIAGDELQGMVENMPFKQVIAYCSSRVAR